MIDITKEKIDNHLNDIINNLNHKFCWWKKMQKTDTITNSMCKARIGNLFYKVRILRFCENSNTVTFEFDEPVLHENYIKIMHSDFKKNKCFNFPIKYLYNLNDNIKEIEKETNNSMGKLFWIPNFWCIEERFYDYHFDCEIIAKFNPNKNNPWPWIVVRYNEKFGNVPHEKSSESFVIKKFGKIPIFTEEEVHKIQFAKKQDNYLYSLEREKEYSAYFWSSIKKNLEVKPMKRKKERRTFKFKLIGLVKGDWITLFETSKGLNYYDNDTFKKNLNVQINKINHNNLSQLKLIKVYNDNKVETKQLKVKTKSQSIHNNYKPPKKREFHVSYTKNGFNKKGLPNLQITETIYGISIKSALRKHKIGFNKLVWIKEAFSFTEKEEEDYLTGIGTKSKLETIYKRSLPLKDKRLEKRYKRIKNSNIKKLKLVSDTIQNKHKSNRLICIQFKDTNDIKRVPINQTKDGTYNMSEWHYTSKSKYKQFRDIKERIDPPKPNETKQMEKSITVLDKRKKRVIQNHEKELNIRRKKSIKYYKKICYYVKDKNGKSIKKVRYGGKKKDPNKQNKHNRSFERKKERELILKLKNEKKQIK